jgi:hypothetical protein
MSMTVWLDVRTGDQRECLESDLSALFGRQEALDALADKLKVDGLTNFFDDTDCRYNMGEDDEFEESEDGWPVDAAKWHDAKSVLRTVEALHAHLLANPKAIAEEDGWTQQSIIEDMDILIPELKKAAKDGKPVHLLIIM